MSDLPGRPSRRRRRFRPWRAVAGLVVLTLVVRLLWGWWSDRQVRAELAQLRAQGQPVEVGDIVIDQVSNAENAWWVQAQAMGAMSASVRSPSNSNLEYPDYPPYSADWMKLADASEQANAPAFALVRQARPLQRVQLPVSVTSPIFAIRLDYLSSARTFAGTLGDGALYAHLQGDDGEAMERLSDLLHLARSLRQGGFVVDQLVAMGVESIACAMIQTISPGLRPTSAATTRPASADQVRRVIEQLLDERLSGDRLRRSIAMERLACIDLARFEASRNWVIRPLADRSIVRMLPNFALMCQAAEKGNWPEAQAVLSRCRWEPPAPRHVMFLSSSPKPVVPRYSRWLGDAGDLSAAANRHFRILAERRLTAVALACHLHRLDHGRLPADLGQLVPRYLAALPADPFHADGRPIGYMTLKGALPGGGDRPVLFYDAGPDAPMPPEPCSNWYVLDPPHCHDGSVRQYRDLVRFIPPSKKAVDDDPQQPDAPGQDAEKDDARP